MDCERFDKIALSLLYEEADELSAASARRHLHHCSRCQGLYSQLRATKEITELPLEAAPDDLFESVLEAERLAQAQLPIPERLSRAVSVLAGYAMRPQLAMAAILLLMIGSSLLFVRNDPSGHDKVRVTELGTPHRMGTTEAAKKSEPLVFPDAAAEQLALGESSDTLAAAGPKATYQDALTAYQEGRYAEAERLFAEVAQAGGEKAASAALHQGHAARNGSGCQRASAIYDRVTERYRGTTISDEASWHAASCYEALGQLGRARSHYQQLEASPAFGDRARKALASLPPPASEPLPLALDSGASAAQQTGDTDRGGVVASRKSSGPGTARPATAAEVVAPPRPASAPASAAPSDTTRPAVDAQAVPSRDTQKPESP